MVDAMFFSFVFVILIVQAKFSFPSIINDCSFSRDIYSSNSAFNGQFSFLNQTYIVLRAPFAFNSPNQNSTAFQLGSVYQFRNANFLIPFPIILNCSQRVRRCQLKTIAVTNFVIRDSEPIPASLNPFNYTNGTMSSTTTTTMNSIFTQMGLYLKQGRYQLNNCTLNDGFDQTDPLQIFSIDIQYEKSIGSSCDDNDTSCGSASLTACSSSKCICQENFQAVEYAGSSYCADTLNGSNCQIFPSRCVTWCNATDNELCICPSGTLKIERNELFICELPVNAFNCSIDDSIRRCPIGQCCTEGQCRSCSTTRTSSTTTTMIAADSNDSNDQRLRIALGVIAGFLGTSVLVLIGAFFFLRHRQKKQRSKAEKSLTPIESSSSKSSLYISPIQEQRTSISSNAIYQLPESSFDLSRPSRIMPTMYRTDSFRRAIQQGQHRPNSITEHVSTKRDSFIETISDRREEFIDATYSNLDYPLSTPPLINDRSLSDSENRIENFYQIIHNSSSPRTRTYAV